MSWLFSQALVAASSVDTSSDGEPCAQLNVMPTAQPFWRNDKTMEPSRLSRFGLTLRLLTADRGEELLTSYLEGFRVRTSQVPAGETASTESDQGSGFRWPGSFAKFDPITSTWRTRQCSLLGGLEEFSEIWPRYGSMRNGECIRRPMLELNILESASGSLRWQTPVADDCVERAVGKWNSRGEPKLSAEVKLWPTPTVCGNYNRKGASATSGDGLETAVQYRTPCASDADKWSRQTVEQRQERGQQIRLTHQVAPDGQLNPTWVEWLMGWPTEWTELKPLETAKFQEWRRQHGGC